MTMLLVFMLAAGQRFLGPPEKAPHAAGEADKPLLNPGDDAPLFSGVLHNPDAAECSASTWLRWSDPTRTPISRRRWC